MWRNFCPTSAYELPACGGSWWTYHGAGAAPVILAAPNRESLCLSRSSSAPLPRQHSDCSFLSASERMRKDAKTWCTSHPYCNLRLGRAVVTPQPGLLHHTRQKKPSSWFQHQSLVEIFNVSNEVLLFNLRKRPLLLWKLCTWVLSENSGSRGSFGSLGGEIVAR